MNKNAIKKFAIEARKKLIDSVTDKAGMLGITEKSCSEPITKGADFEVYQTVAGTEVTLNKKQCEQRRRLVSQIESPCFLVCTCSLVACTGCAFPFCCFFPWNFFC